MPEKKDLGEFTRDDLTQLYNNNDNICVFCSNASAECFVVGCCYEDRLPEDLNSFLLGALELVEMYKKGEY